MLDMELLRGFFCRLHSPVRYGHDLELVQSFQSWDVSILCPATRSNNSDPNLAAPHTFSPWSKTKPRHKCQSQVVHSSAARFCRGSEHRLQHARKALLKFFCA